MIFLYAHRSARIFTPLTSFVLCLAILREYRIEKDGQTDRRTDGHRRQHITR